MGQSIAALRQAARSLGRAPGFSLIVLVTFALGIGASTAIFSLVRGTLLRELPFPRADRLAMVWERAPQGRNDRNPVNPANYMAWRERSRSFASLSAVIPWTATLAGSSGTDGGAERVKVAYVASSFFDTLGVPAKFGRAFLDVEGTESHDAVVVLSEALWRRRFAGQVDIVGQQVLLDGESVRVVGVAPAGFDVPPGTEVWNPIGFGPRHREAKGRAYGVVGRLRDGLSLDQAQHEMESIVAQLTRERPEMNAGWGVNVVPLREQLVGGVRLGLLLLFAAVGGLLLIACANLANLWMLRALASERELAVRHALGAQGRRLLLQPVLEALGLALVGGGLGIAVAHSVLGVLLRFAPTEIPGFVRIAVDGWALVFACVLTLLVALVVAALPAYRAARVDAARLLAASRGATSDGRLRRVLVALEVGMALVLLVATALLARSLLRLRGTDVGFEPAGIAVLQIDLPRLTYREPAQIERFYADLLARARALPGVERVGAVSWLPFGGMVSRTGFHSASAPAGKAENDPVTDVWVVTPGTFSTLRLALLTGRDFDVHDDGAAPKRVIVSAAVARDLFPGRDALGQWLVVSWGSDPGGLRCEIVGVAAPARLTSMDKAPEYAVFLPQAQSPSNFMSVLVRSAVPPAELANQLTAVVRALDPQVAAGGPRALTEVAGAALKRPRFLTFLLTAFAGAALLLSAVGVYGVLAYGVAQRRREIGIRMAIGARAGDVARLVLRDGLQPAVLGAGAGLLASLALARLLRGLLFEITPGDPLSWGVAVACLLLAAALACVLPAWRAARVHPTVALRQE